MAKRGKTQESVRLSAESLVREIEDARGVFGQSPMARLVCVAERLRPCDLETLIETAKLLERKRR